MKTYYFEDHIKISDRKPVEGYVEAYNGENKIFEGHNLVVDAGRELVKDYIMGNLYLFYGESDVSTTPDTTIPDSSPAATCQIPSSSEQFNDNNISITRTDTGLVVSLNIVINPMLGVSRSIQELGTFFQITGTETKTLFSRITFPPIPLTTDPITFIYKLYF